MCGRYASSRAAAELAPYFDVAEQPHEPPVPSWNVAPTDPVLIVVHRHDARQLRVARWGLVPSWAKDPKIGAKMINARSETLQQRPAFRSAYERRRCLVPADGYYEWQRVEGRKQPWFLTSRDRTPLAMAGLYEIWRGAGAEWLWTCSIITTDAVDDLGTIHDRTPLLVPAQHWSRWLDPAVGDPGALAVAGSPDVLDAWRVGPAVGNVRNDGPELVEPVAS